MVGFGGAVAGYPVRCELRCCLACFYCSGGDFAEVGRVLCVHPDHLVESGYSVGDVGPMSVWPVEICDAYMARCLVQ